MAVLEKKPLSLAELESQTAFVLPDRELMQNQTGLVNVSIGSIVLQVPVAAAATICGVQVGVLAAGLAQGPVNCPNSPFASIGNVTVTR